MKKNWGFFLRLTVSLAALAGLVFVLRGRLGEAFAIIRGGLQWKWFLLAVLFYFLATAVISWRLQLIFRVQEVKVSFRQSFYLSLLGLFFNLFFPSALGGDVAKGYFAYQYSGKKLGSFTGVVLDRLLGFVTLIVIAFAALGGYRLGFSTPGIKDSLYGALGATILGTAFFSSRRFAGKFQFFSFLIPSAKWRQNLADLYRAVQKYRHHRGILGTCLAISVVGQFLFLTDVFFLGRSIGIEASLGPYLVLMPLVAFASMAPSFSGLGVREAGFVFFFKSVMLAEKAFALSLIYDFLFYGIALLAGLLFAVKGGLRKELIHDLEEGARKISGGST